MFCRSFKNICRIYETGIKIESNIPTFSKHPHEAEWNHHGSYQWTYFSEEVKQRVKFFLHQRLKGKNLDIGGGWHLVYPNSTVVDLSHVCLKNNPAQEKVIFNLEEISKGAKLPFKDNAFNSATLVSVWQYLENPISVIKELERVLIPGAEVYIINGQGGGLEECIRGSGKSKTIQSILEAEGYDTLLEVIPFYRAYEFQSVCVAMPDRDLFGPVPSHIRNKQERIEKQHEIVEDSRIFADAFREHEIRTKYDLLSRLATYPVTEFSVDFLRRAELFSREYYEQTGARLLLFSQYTTEPEVFMRRSEEDWIMAGKIFMGKEYKEVQEKLRDKYGISTSTHIGFFRDFKSISSLLEYCKDYELIQSDYFGSRGNESYLDIFVRFLVEFPLDSFTKQLQEQIYQALHPRVESLDKKLMRQKAAAISFLTYESKNKRRIDELIARKHQILDAGTGIVEMRDFEFRQFIPYFKSLIR
ncbi:methyltransferase domain-containing protein [Candidatus Woesearchaeota archaeon]|nr:methyltransferase domain-containing protein [Candidatus Woesearchaeota archaeon]